MPRTISTPVEFHSPLRMLVVIRVNDAACRARHPISFFDKIEAGRVCC